MVALFLFLISLFILFFVLYIHAYMKSSILYAAKIKATCLSICTVGDTEEEPVVEKCIHGELSPSYADRSVV
jgi:hypothetical protein